MKEHAEWFHPGSLSLSFLVAAIAGAVIVSGVFFLVRYLTRRNLAEGGAHH